MPKSAITAGFWVVVVALLTWGAFEMIEQVNADEIMCVQDVIGGNLTFYTTPGWKNQHFGKVTKYKKWALYTIDQSIRFNDGGHGVMKGSIQYNMPLDNEHLSMIHMKFGNMENVQTALIEKTVLKSVYMVGPIMSSRESASERRNDLVHYVDDQIRNGVYKTAQKDVKQVDVLSGEEKTVAVVEIVKDSLGNSLRQDVSVLNQYGIAVENFSISGIEYDKVVDKQIADQQSLYMEVITSIADAKKAEQRAITVEKNGQAAAAEAKWKQEAIKAQAVTEAEQALAVQELAAQTAKQYAIEIKTKADADAYASRKAIEANGALEIKLATLEQMNRDMWENIAKYPGSWVPQTVFGSAGGSKSDGTAQYRGIQDFIDLTTMNMVRQLNVDTKVP